MTSFSENSSKEKAQRAAFILFEQSHNFLLANNSAKLPPNIPRVEEIGLLGWVGISVYWFIERQRICCGSMDVCFSLPRWMLWKVKYLMSYLVCLQWEANWKTPKNMKKITEHLGFNSHHSHKHRSWTKLCGTELETVLHVRCCKSKDPACPDKMRSRVSEHNSVRTDGIVRI